MSTETRITVNGVEMVDGQEPEARPEATRHLIIDAEGKPVTAIMYDGITPFVPGDGRTVVPEADWKGPAIEPEPEPAEVKARRTRADRVNALATRLDGDIKGWDALTPAQRTAATLRGLRLVRALVREMRDDSAED